MFTDFAAGKLQLAPALGDRSRQLDSIKLKLSDIRQLLPYCVAGNVPNRGRKRGHAGHR
jgi:hypothetical protein